MGGTDVVIKVLGVSALLLVSCFATASTESAEDTWNQNGEVLPLGVVRRCIDGQSYLLVVGGGVPGGGWPLSITPALQNGRPKRCKQPSASDVASDPGPYGQRLRELEADRLRRKTGYSSF